jgi:hypothetical protein
VEADQHHAGAGQRPRLAAEVAQLAKPQPHLLADLAAGGLLERLPRLDEPGDEGPQVRAVRVPDQQERRTGRRGAADRDEHGGG